MKLSSILMAILALATVGTGALVAQSSIEDKDRQELLRELREVEKQAAKLRQELFTHNRPGYSGTLQGQVAPRVLGTLSLFGRRARLGVYVRMEADPDTDSKGAVLERVTEEGPADKAGLMAGDIITHWDGESLTGRYPAARDGQSEPASKLVDLVRELEEGDTVDLIYLREAESRTANVTAEELSSSSFLAPGSLSYRDLDKDGQVDLFFPQGVRPEISRFPALGILSQGLWSDIELLKLSPELGGYFGTDRGLLVIELPEENTFELEVGDVILSVGDREPRDASHLLRILRSYDSGETVNLNILRKKQGKTLRAEVPEDQRFGMARPSIWTSERSI